MLADVGNIDYICTRFAFIVPIGGGKGEYTGPRLPMCLSIRELSEILGAKGIILEQCEPI